jgi:hypothetical protein
MFVIHLKTSQRKKKKKNPVPIEIDDAHAQTNSSQTILKSTLNHHHPISHDVLFCPALRTMATFCFADQGKNTNDASKCSQSSDNPPKKSNKYVQTQHNIHYQSDESDDFPIADLSKNKIINKKAPSSKHSTTKWAEAGPSSKHCTARATVLLWI